MPRKKTEKSPLQELADQADVALALCWERLQADEVDAETIELFVKSWRAKRAAYMEDAHFIVLGFRVVCDEKAEEEKQHKKEAKDSDG